MGNVAGNSPGRGCSRCGTGDRAEKVARRTSGANISARSPMPDLEVLLSERSFQISLTGLNNRAETLHWTLNNRTGLIPDRDHLPRYREIIYITWYVSLPRT